MDTKNSKEENLKEAIKDKLVWNYDIPDPVPGLVYLEPKITYDFKPYDDSLENFIPPTIHTDPMELFDVDYMGIVLDSLCGQDEQAVEDEEKIVEQITDYQIYIQNSFEDVNEIEHPFDSNIGIKEVYDVFPADDSKIFQLLQIEGGVDVQISEELKIEDCPVSNLYKFAVAGDKKHKCIKSKGSDYLILETEGDKVSFHDVEGIYRIVK